MYVSKYFALEGQLGISTDMQGILKFVSLAFEALN